MNALLTCNRINKNYGKTEAVRNLDLTLEKNTIYGLLGRNGAGKTTLLNIMTGGIFYDSGQITFAGTRLQTGGIPENTCLVREKNLFFPGAKIMDILEMASVFQRHWDMNLAHDLIQSFDLNPNKKIKQLSRGMESLVGNIVGMASRATLTIFDEPVLGLDVLMREKFYQILKEDHTKHPRTILISTHLIDEITSVVEQIYIMEAGKVLLHDEVKSIQEHSFSVTGPEQQVRKFVVDKRVIYQQSNGRDMLAVLYGPINKNDQAKAAQQGIKIDQVPLQKMFSYMVEGGEMVV